MRCGLSLSPWSRTLPGGHALSNGPPRSACRITRRGHGPTCLRVLRPKTALSRHVAVVLRKNLGSHEYLKHAQWSPVRHFAHGPFCVACHTWWHSVRRVQVHMRQDNGCLARAVHIVPPLTKDQILQLEASDREREQAVHKGAWTKHVRVQPPQRLLGPPTPTRAERHDCLGEDLLLSELSHGFLPQPGDVGWIAAYLSEGSVEGSRQTAC